MKNLVIFCGAFDPIHNGHINMAESASKELDADVLFVPARISVWKNETAPVEDKIKMIELAIADSEYKNRLHVDRFEADSKSDKNYSIDTVRHFKNIYKDFNLYFLIGTDQVNSFHLWQDAFEISKLVQIIYFDRPGLELDQNQIDRFSMKKVHGDVVEVSSSDIRALKSAKTPLRVLNYIIDHNLYFTPKIRSYLDEKRFLHSVSVANLSYEIAKSNNLDIKEDCFIAGLLHDIGKNVPKDEQCRIINELYSEYSYLSYPIYHQFISEYLCKKDFDIINKDILKAIEFHTTANAEMSHLGIILYSADKIDPLREFDSSFLIESIKVNLLNGFSVILKDNIKYFESHNVDYKSPLMMACLNKYIIK